MGLAFFQRTDSAVLFVTPTICARAEQQLLRASPRQALAPHPAAQIPRRLFVVTPRHAGVTAAASVDSACARPSRSRFLDYEGVDRLPVKHAATPPRRAGPSRRLAPRAGTATRSSSRALARIKTSTC